MPKLRMNEKVSSNPVEGFSPENTGLPLDEPLPDMNPYTFS
jgi:hypothetical protein